MGGKGGRGPAPPDPQDLARAATGTNIATAIANLAGNTGSVTTPFGSTTQTQTGTHKYTDPYTGETYEIPIFDTSTQLSGGEQNLYNQGLENRTLFGGQAGTSDAVAIGQAVPGFNDYLNRGPNQLDAGDSTRAVTIGGAVPGFNDYLRRGPNQFDAGDSTRAVTIGGAVPGFNDYLRRGPNQFDPGDNAASRFFDARREARQADQAEALRVSQAARGVGGAGGDIADREFLRQQAGFTDERLADDAAAINAGLGIFGANQAAEADFHDRGLRSAALRDQLRSGAVNRQATEFGANQAAEADFHDRGLRSAALRDQLRSGAVNRQATEFGANQAAEADFFDRGLRSSVLRDQLRSGGLNRQLARAHAAQPNIPGQAGRVPLQIPTTDVAGLINQNYQQQLQRRQAGQQGSVLGSLLGLGAAFI